VGAVFLKNTAVVLPVHLTLAVGLFGWQGHRWSWCGLMWRLDVGPNQAVGCDAGGELMLECDVWHGPMAAAPSVLLRASAG
jgi:hypothetical protein